MMTQWIYTYNDGLIKKSVKFFSQGLRPTLEKGSQFTSTLNALTLVLKYCYKQKLVFSYDPYNLS